MKELTPIIDAVPKAEYERVVRERDAAVADLKIADKNCRFCRWYDKTYKRGKYCANDEECGYEENNRWEWRGVQDETN